MDHYSNRWTDQTFIPITGDLLAEIDVLMSYNDINADVWIINDGSTIEPSFDDIIPTFHALKKINIIQLSRNLGHQRGISIGLSYLSDNYDYPAVIIMDADGEDKPEDVLKLIDAQENNPGDIIIAKRGKRHESILFKFLFYIYKIIFRFASGQNIQNGNFCLIPRKRLKQIVAMSEIWNHFSTGLHKSNIPKKLVLCERGKRYTGQSKMNFVSLIIHGLGSISIYIEIAGVRAIIASLSLMGVLFVVSCAVIYIRLFTNMSIPGWTTYTLGLLMVLIFQLFVVIVVFSFLILSLRTSSDFIPIRDYKVFILEVNDYSHSTTSHQHL